MAQSKKLTAKQELFCMYYVKYFNATAAYLKAYPNIVYETAMANGYRMLRNAQIKTKIAELKKELTDEIKVEAMDVLKELTKIAFSDMGNYVKFGVKEINGPCGKYIKNYVESKDYKKVDTSLIQEVSTGKDGFKIKLADKMKALALLSNYFDLTEDNNKDKEAKKFVIEFVGEDVEDAAD